MVERLEKAHHPFHAAELLLDGVWAEELEEDTAMEELDNEGVLELEEAGLSMLELLDERSVQEDEL